MLIPTPKWGPDAGTLGDACPTMENCYYTERGVRPIPGLVDSRLNLGEGESGHRLDLSRGDFLVATETSTYAVERERVRRFDAGGMLAALAEDTTDAEGNTVQAIDKTGLSSTTGNFTDHVIYDGFVYLPNINVTLRRLSEVTHEVQDINELEAKKGSVPLASYITQFKEHLIVGDIRDNRNNIQWSGTADPLDWSTENNGDIQPFPDMGRVMGLAVAEELIVFGDNEIHIGTFNDGDPELGVFTFDRVATNQGLFVPNAFYTWQDKTYFLSRDGFFAWNGHKIVPISDEFITREYFIRLNPARVSEIRVGVIPDLNSIYFTCPGTNGVFLYRYLSDSWSFWNEDIRDSALIRTSSLTPDTISESNFEGYKSETGADTPGLPSPDAPDWFAGPTTLNFVVGESEGSTNGILMALGLTPNRRHLEAQTAIIDLPTWAPNQRNTELSYFFHEANVLIDNPEGYIIEVVSYARDSYSTPPILTGERIQENRYGVYPIHSRGRVFNIRVIIRPDPERSGGFGAGGWLFHGVDVQARSIGKYGGTVKRGFTEYKIDNSNRRL